MRGRRLYYLFCIILLPLHCSPQGLVSFAFPVQFLPSPSGGGCVQKRYLFCTPSQSLLQFDHSVHSVKFPSWPFKCTKKPRFIKFPNKVFSWKREHRAIQILNQGIFVFLVAIRVILILLDNSKKGQKRNGEQYILGIRELLCFSVVRSI